MNDVYLGGTLIGRYADGDTLSRNVILVGLTSDRSIRFKELAAAFELSTEQLRRIRRRYERGGVEALVHQKKRGPRSKVGAALRRRLFKLFDEGATVSVAHRGIRGRVSRAVVGRVRQQWAEERGVETPRRAAEAKRPEARQPELPLTIQADGVTTSPSEGSGEGHGVPVARPENDNAVGRTKSLAARELGLEQACAQGGRRVQHVGSWIMLGMLEALGLYERAERHRGRSVGKIALRVALDAVAMALCLGQGCVEGVRRLHTPSAPTLLRELAPPSASWTRRVLGRFAQAAGVFLQLGMVHEYVERNRRGASQRAVFYIDNHLRPYTGKHTIRKGWRMQDKRARPGITDYYLHDEDGRPLLRFDVPSHDSLVQWLPPMGRFIQQAVGHQSKVLLVFDRAGAFASHLAALRDEGFEFVTYERRPYPAVVQSAFDQELTLARESIEWTEGRKNLGKGRGRVRRIVLRMADGEQVNIVAHSKADAELLIRALLARWARQENQFKHEVERWGINQLDGRKVEPYPPDAVIPNPARRRLDWSLRLARSREAEALRQLAHLPADDPRRERLKQEAARLVVLQRHLEQQRPSVPERAPLRDTELAGKLVLHPGAYKSVIDTLRIALANIESELAAELGPLLPQEAEAKKTLGNLLHAPGEVMVHKRSVRIALEPAGSRAERVAFAELLDDINARRLRLPGDPSRRVLRFQVHI